MKKKRISIIITAFNEPGTVGRLVQSIEKQIERITHYEFEILLICPDEETRAAGNKSDKLKILTWLQDEGRGKPAALNIGFKKASGEYLILTDGDVEMGVDAVAGLLSGLVSSRAGAVTGRPVPVNSRDNMFGYWAHLLTNAGAHRKRLEQDARGKFIVCSGYLMGVKAGLVTNIPENTLVDDAYISHVIWQKGYSIRYVPDAEVKVKFPDNFGDWLKQKKRSTGGYSQLSQLLPNKKESMRSFTKEVLGIKSALSYPKNIKEYLWTILLIFARIYLWMLVFLERRVFNKSFEKTWVRVESTK